MSAKKKSKPKAMTTAKTQSTGKKSLKVLNFKVANKKIYEVTCADYHAWVEAPASIVDCEQRIAIIRHASTCTDCLRFALKLLAEMPEDANKELIAEIPPVRKEPKPLLPYLKDRKKKS